MKIVQINTTCGIGSTGKICLSISKMLTDYNIENYIIYTQGDSNYPLAIKCASRSYKKMQALKSYVMGNWGFNSKFATSKIIRELKKIKPDIIHIHNIHGHDCNLTMLFEYIKRENIKVLWTFHDCWAFTAYCPYFTHANCEKWKYKCEKCPQIRSSSWFFDRSNKLFELKKILLSNLNLTIITPSNWLAELVKESFLKNNNIVVINNGIDLSKFKPTANQFRQEYGIPVSKKILLGVAFDWGIRKGLDVFVELSRRLDNEKYQIVLVGTNDDVDKCLPNNIISIHRTQNQKELAKIYTAADLFVNPTREDNYPTVNMEAIACGTPVLTFKTGGSPECIDEASGSAVECDDIDSLEQMIYKMTGSNTYTKSNCLNRAKEFDENRRFKEYIDLYVSKSNNGLPE